MTSSPARSMLPKPRSGPHDSRQRTTNCCGSTRRAPPDGACDDDCGCVSAPADGAGVATTTQAVSLSAKPQPAGAAAIACTLSAGSIKRRIADWQNLLTHVTRRERIDGGVRNLFAADVSTGELMRLVAAEQDCCQFFQFAITIDTGGVALEVRAPAAALPIVTAMFGEPS